MPANPELYDDNVVPMVKPHTVVVPIDPATATRWIGRNTHNRALRPDTIRIYIRDMVAGDWKLTGESIKFAVDGTLLDGQHRLAAIAESGVTVPMFVTRNLPTDAQQAMDSGMKRTASDALALIGGSHTGTTAASARLALGVASDNIDRYSATHAEILAFVEENPTLVTAAEFATKVARRTDCPPAVVGYTTWRLGQINADAAYNFWTSAAEKVGLAAGDPVVALTNRLAEARRNRETLSKPAMLSLIYRAWNARRAGRPMRLLKVNSPAGGIVPIPDPR